MVRPRDRKTAIIREGRREPDHHSVAYRNFCRMCGKKFNSWRPGKGRGDPRRIDWRRSMRPNRLALALALAFLSLPMVALAQDAPASQDAAPQDATPPDEAAPAAPAAEEEDSGPVTWSLALTSDYVF